jgi:hypothetical protein
MNIHGHLSPQRLGQNHNITKLSTITLNILSIGTNSSSYTPNNRPGIHHSLTTSHHSPSLQTRVIKPPHHFSRTYIPILFIHISTRRQQHQYKITLAHTLGIQITQYIRGPNPSLQVRAIHKWKEEIGGTDTHVTLPRFANGAVESNLAVVSAHVLTVSQSQARKHGLQCGLGDFAGSSF